jgi:hypothetical protein
MPGDPAIVHQYRQTERIPADHSHSIVPGGFEVMS